MNFEEKNRINGLFGFYGELLTAKQQDYLRYYFEDDYSIVEIAEAELVSRQAVSDNIKRGIDQLVKYEHVLHLQRNFEARSAIEKQVQAYIDLHYRDDETLKQLVSQLLAHEIED
ncbi:YlxM family DNA-binding protein [Leuconostoc citreum]|uniref:YlxM family DNA-binding protein n=1 Tax=Leuconostoc citreum TaxID=33964 RepID=UPI000246592C|nr:YlxM family DNA-binding protein [Leuconostoc citreum]MBA5938932.1 YlxM family DNA-binding protein [Leuconostoc citreum]MCS8583765.1 DNA-binding protein [Leuconostoc citreum]MCS8601759.1 DNA-binding protein [Leuconostoc citreum]MDV8931385.1 YlxM family DNA-binding protein [Leuconostoc citreum]OSP81216.1 DNA-binding protein [Leuconostoc citreum]